MAAVQLSPTPNAQNIDIKLEPKEISGESSPRNLFPDSFDHNHDAELITSLPCTIVQDMETKREEPQYIFPHISSYTNLSSMSTQIKWPLYPGQKLSVSEDNKVSEMNEYIDTTQDANICCIGKDIHNCIGLQRITSILSFYSTHYDNCNAVDAYLSKYNMRKHLVNDYHHIIDKHLNEDNHSKRKCEKQFELIYKKMMEEKHLFCSIHTCNIWVRNNRQREISPNIEGIAPNNDKLRMFMDILDTIHCYFMHSVDIGHRIIIQDEHLFDEKNVSKCYDARMAFLRRYLAPKKSMQWQKKVAMRNVRFATKIADNPLTMSGYLRKESMYLKQLRQRYIVLENECLYSYKSDLKAELTECIDLSEFDHVQISESGAIGQFELIQDENYNNKRVFIASSMQELDDWLIALKRNMLHVKRHYVSEAKNENCEKENESIGERYDYWSQDSIYPKYESIKEEVTCNKIYSISMDAFTAAFNKAIHLRTSHKIRNMMICKEVTDEYDLRWDATPRIDHILALVLWTDYRVLSAEFRQTFDKISKKIYDEFWIWSKFLIECVNAFGTRLKKSKNKMCFHIVHNQASRNEQHMQYEMIFNAPTSMTTKLEIAILNAPKKNGIILEVTNYKKLRYFNCSFVSYFGNEDERLFVEPPHLDKNYCLHVLSIRNLATNENYAQYIDAIRALDKLFSGGMYDESVLCDSDKECITNMNGIIAILSDEECEDEEGCKLVKYVPSYVMHALEEWSDNILNITFDSYLNDKIVPKIDLYLNYPDVEFNMMQFDKLNVMFKQLISIQFIIYVQASSNVSAMNELVDYQSIAAMLQRINQLKYSKLNDIRIGYHHHHDTKHMKQEDEEGFGFAANWKDFEPVIAAVAGWQMIYIEDDKILQIKRATTITP